MHLRDEYMLFALTATNPIVYRLLFTVALHLNCTFDELECPWTILRRLVFANCKLQIASCVEL